MDSFDIGRVLGASVMTFAMFVIVHYALSKIPGMKTRYAAMAGISFVLNALLLLASAAPIEIKLASFLLFVAACIAHYFHHKSTVTK